MPFSKKCFGVGIALFAVVLSSGVAWGQEYDPNDPSNPSNPSGSEISPIEVKQETDSSSVDAAAAAVDGGAGKVIAAAETSTNASCVDVKNAVKSSQAAVKSCASSKNMARNFCLEKMSPHIMEAMTIVSGLASAASMVKACEAHKSGLDKLNMVFQAYTTACGAFRYKCESACAASVKLTTAAKTAVGKCPNAQAVAEQYLKDTDTAIAKSTGVCESYKWQLANAAAMLGKMGQSAGLDKQCEEKTADQPTKIDCTKPENVSLEQCICEKTPNLKGCPTANGSFNAGGVASAGLTGSSSAQGLTGVNPGSFGYGSQSTGGIPGGSTGGGGSGAGSGAAGAGAGGTGKGADGKSAGTGSRFNTNVLDGGGGGGGRGGGSGRSGFDDSPYKAYMPGGAKDPSRSAASLQKMEVTGAGGEDNFQKISNRYRQNKSTLMGQ